MKKIPLSLVVITKNEAANLERCLRSVPFVDDIVVVDTQSTDGTPEIARKNGARVFDQAWKGFGAQKKFAAEQAHNKWILSLDADEALSPDLADEIQAEFANLDPHTGYLLPRRSFHLGRWICHGGWTPDYQLKLFNRDHSQFNEAPIHEKVIAAKTAKFKNPVLHWVFKTLSHQVITNDKYSSLQADERHARGEKFSVLRLVIKPPVKFLETYVFKMGFLDGMPGFLISVGASYSVFLRYAKMWELEK